jgi:peptide/nickel transport system substrate-binding protein
MSGSWLGCEGIQYEGVRQMSGEQGLRAKRARMGVTTVLVAVVVLAGACSSSGRSTATGGTSSSSAGTPKVGGTLVVGIPTESPGWNPSINEWDDTANLVGSSVIEPLATAGADSAAKPWLATSWSASANYTVWTIKLRSGVQFQDGEPFNAQAVVDNFQAAFKSPFYTLTIGPLFAGVKVVDDTTVEVDLKQPWAAFPSSFLDSESTMMMAPAMINSSDQGSSHPIGTGPFTFASWQPNNNFKVTRNPHYWGGLGSSGQVLHGTPYLNAIEFRVIPDDTTRASSLQSGDINMLSTISAQTANTLTGSYDEVRNWDSGSVFVQPNTQATVTGHPNPFANIHARRALAYATQPRAVADIEGQGLEVATSPFAPKTPWGLPASQNGYVQYDLAKAKAEVAQYKSQTGQSSLTFDLMGLPDTDAERQMQVLAAQWQQAGIVAHIQTLDQETRITAIVSGNYEATFTNNYGYPDPDSEYYFWTSAGVSSSGGVSINFAHYATPQIDHDMNTGRQDATVSVREAAYHDVAKQLNAGFTHIWLYYTPFTYVADKDVQGLDTPQGPGTVPFGNFMPKTWWNQVWLSS